MTITASIWPGIEAHGSGAIWIADARTLLIADLHLGYGWAQRRRGQLGPVGDTITAALLADVLKELHPGRIVLLGDIVHAPKPSNDERDWIESVLGGLQANAELVCVRGNHDRGFLEDFARLRIELVEDWWLGDVRSVHGDRLPEHIPAGERWIFGHWHPAVRIEDTAGASRKLPAFVVTPGFTVMPAFSPFAAGVDAWKCMPDELSALCAPTEPELIAVTGKRAVRLGPLTKLRSPAIEIRPARYRRRQNGEGPKENS